MRLYGKDNLKSRLERAATLNRLSHAILLYGQNGYGKKVVARYIAKLFICGAIPCEGCNNCRTINADGHPDVCFVKQRSGGKYSVDAIRDIVTDSLIKPNNGDIKVYIFEDCDDMSDVCQNTLLKLIEEPAAYLKFIFTCESMNSLLETIRSRTTEFEVMPMSVEDCVSTLVDNGCESGKARELAELFSGNPGKCQSSLSDDEEKMYIEAARKIARAIASKNKFATSAALTENTGRGEFAAIQNRLSEILRDALVIRCGGNAESCGKTEAADIAKVYNEQDIIRMLEAIMDVGENTLLNLNMQLTTAYLTARLF